MTADRTVLAERLRVARKQAGLTQAQVARLLDIHRPTVSEIEAGRRNVTAGELNQFAEIYEVSMAWLSGSEAEDLGVSAKVALAARGLANLRDEDLDTVLKLIAKVRSSGSRK